MPSTRRRVTAVTAQGLEPNVKTMLQSELSSQMTPLTLYDIVTITIIMNEILGGGGIFIKGYVSQEAY